MNTSRVHQAIKESLQQVNISEDFFLFLNLKPKEIRELFMRVYHKYLMR